MLQSSAYRQHRNAARNEARAVQQDAREATKQLLGEAETVNPQPYKSPALRARQLSGQTKAPAAKPQEVPSKQPAAHGRTSSRASAGIKQGFKQSRQSRSTKRLSTDLPLEPNSAKVGAIYGGARGQVCRLGRSRSKSNTYRAVTTQGSTAGGKKPSTAAAKPKPKQASIDQREALFNNTNITLDNYDMKQTPNRQSAAKKEASLPKYHPARQTLRSASSRGRSLGAGDRRSKGRASTCSLESRGSHTAQRTMQPVRTASREGMRISAEER